MKLPEALFTPRDLVAMVILVAFCNVSQAQTHIFWEEPFVGNYGNSKIGKAVFRGLKIKSFLVWTLILRDTSWEVV